MPRRVIILGSTGSIGTQTLGVIDHLNALQARGEFGERFEVAGLAAGKNVAVLIEQVARHPRAELAIAHPDVRDLAIGEQGLSATFSGKLLRARHGMNAAERLVREVECDLVVAAMVGSAGLPATLAAADLGRDVALANKETLVAAGALVVASARRSGSKLLPIDSEHSGVWQCLAARGAVPPVECGSEVARVILTASGGPFRSWSKDRIARATPADALNHPTWSMGPKVTVDSASLMNKGLELIEAHWLFGLGAERLGVLVHPQSIVHAIVEFADGSSLAQMGVPDMRGPIQHALTFPRRARALVESLDWRSLGTLDFEAPDAERFPALALAYDVLRAGPGSAAGAVLSAANEQAVAEFLRPGSTLPFGRIVELVRDAMSELGGLRAADLPGVLDAEARARAFVRKTLER